MPTTPNSPSAPRPSNADAELRRLIEEQGRQLQELQALTQKVYNYIWWQRILFVFKVLLIVVPIVLGILYLPPLIENALSPYRTLLGNPESGNGSIDYGAEWQQYLYDLSQ